MKLAAVLTMLLGLAGCSLFSSKPPPQEIEIKPPAAADASLDLMLVASPLINPGVDGTPGAMVVRVYELSAPTKFAGANFRQLWEADAATLGTTMLGSHEMIVAPGGVVHVKAKMNEKTLMIGVVAGFRDVTAAKWRALIPLHGETTFALKATLKTNSVDLGAQDD